MAAIPEDYHDLFERKTFAHVATVMPDGMPHVTPVWIDYDPETEQVLINTERGRQKARNVERNPQVGDRLSQRYTGGDYPGEIETERVLWRVQPERAF
jgi:predicted pyridoxine 5'-phosphate oxidase superfamily flavin-nucleotide-binding protein